jgi:hypothetical protein
MDMESYQNHIKPKLPWNFSIHHESLVFIVFGALVVDKNQLVTLNEERICQRDIDMMSLMVKIEFESSLQKEMEGSDALFHAKSEPKPYEIFLVERTLEQSSSPYRVSICFPMKKSTNHHENYNASNELVWYNGGQDLIPLDDLNYKWRIGSLAGPARILENLHAGSCQLTEWFMNRTGIISPIMDQFDVVIDQLDIPYDMKQNIMSMNTSQRQAVATVADMTYFRDGFFAIHGPPGKFLHLDYFFFL